MNKELSCAEYTQAFAFLGNSLLATMRQTGDAGLKPEFWAAFPDFGSAAVEEALEGCFAWAQDAAQRAAEGADVLTDVCVEYTRLFVGPPSPAAAPWESFYVVEGNTVGFGEPTFQMQEALRAAGLQVSNENNQYADHIGIELLYASVICERLAQADGDAEAQEELAEKLKGFAQNHPLAWIGKLQVAVASVEPAGYIAALLELGRALLSSI